MLYHKLEGLCDKVSVLSLGTMNFGDTMDESTSFQVMDIFYAMGGNFIDTARIYGDLGGPGKGTSEKVIGRWIKSRGLRDKIILATKGGHPPVEDMHQGRLDEKNLRSDLESSLKDLDTDVIDLYWLHRDDPALPVEEILSTLNGFMKEGKIRAIGASNWSAGRLEQARLAAEKEGLTGFCANQPMWSLARNEDHEDITKRTMVQMDKELYDWHRATGVPCVAYTSQAKGLFAKLHQGGVEALSPKARERYYTPHNAALYEVVKDICEETGLSAAALPLAYITNQKDFAGFPIVGVSRLEQARALEEAGSARLTQQQLARLLKGAELEK